MYPEYWMDRDRAAKPLTLSAQLAAMTAERDALLKRLEAGKKLAEAVDWYLNLYRNSCAAEWKDAAVSAELALVAWRAADGG